jgi:hypothetical protein
MQQSHFDQFPVIPAAPTIRFIELKTDSEGDLEMETRRSHGLAK